jgi:hypothetical protein
MVGHLPCQYPCLEIVLHGDLTHFDLQDGGSLFHLQYDMVSQVSMPQSVLSLPQDSENLTKKQDSLYGSHPIVFTIKQTAFVQSNKTQVYFNQFNCPHMYATRFSVYLGHLKACQYEEHIWEDTMKIQGAPSYGTPIG